MMMQKPGSPYHAVDGCMPPLSSTSAMGEWKGVEKEACRRGTFELKSYLVGVWESF